MFRDGQGKRRSGGKIYRRDILIDNGHTAGYRLSGEEEVLPYGYKHGRKEKIMKKWYDEEYEFTVEVVGFLRGDHTDKELSIV